MTTCLSRLTLSTSSTTMWLASLVTLPRVGIAAMYARDGAAVPRTISRANRERFMMDLLRCDSLPPGQALQGRLGRLGGPAPGVSGGELLQYPPGLGRADVFQDFHRPPGSEFARGQCQRVRPFQ